MVKCTDWSCMKHLKAKILKPGSKLETTAEMLTYPPSTRTTASEQSNLCLTEWKMDRHYCLHLFLETKQLADTSFNTKPRGQNFILLCPLNLWQNNTNSLLIFILYSSQKHMYTHTHTQPILQTTIGFSELSHSGRKSILHLLSPIIRSHVDNPTIHFTFKTVGNKKK